MSLSRIVRSFRRPLFAIALLAAGLVTAAGMTNPAQAQYYPYYAGYPYYSYGYAYPYYAGYPYYGYGWGHRHWGHRHWGYGHWCGGRWGGVHVGGGLYGGGHPRSMPAASDYDGYTCNV